MKAVTLRQPFAWLVVNGFKDVENRSWATSHRGPLLIHAAKKWPTGELMDELEKRYRLKIPDDEMVFGGIVGRVELVDCVTAHPSPWFKGPIGWVFTNPKRLRFRPLAGKLKLFDVDA